MGNPSFQANGQNSQELYSQTTGTASSDPFITVYFNRDPTANDANYPVKKRWINLSTKVEWILVSFTNVSGQTLANWIPLQSSSIGGLTNLVGNDGVQVVPGAGNNINLLGLVVSNSSIPQGVYTASTGANTEDVKVQLSAAIVATDVTKVGLSAFNNTQFTVDGNGFVSLVGSSPAIVKFQVDQSTPPGTDPVIPNAGLVTITGGQISAGSTTNVIQTNSLAANTFTIQIQRTQAVAISTIGDNGVAHFSSSQFTVDANGFVQLKGGIGPTMLTITGDDAVAVSPSVTGNINLQGLVVNNGTHAKAVFTESPSVNTEKIDIQVSTAISATDVTKVGLASFDSAQFLVDVNGFVTTNKFNNLPFANLGIAQSGGTTFTVESSNGSALSATNPAFVTLQTLAVPGLTKTYTITANQSFTQANISGNNFGLTNGLAFANPVPFFLYAVSNANNGENTIAFMVSRFPNATKSPVAGKIGQNGSALSNSAGSFFSLAAITAADYASSPCLCVGSFRMTWAASNNWTIQTLVISDGIGLYQQGIQFSSVAGHFGNAAGSFFKSNGGTAPIWSSQNWAYYLTRDNRCNFNAAFSSNTTPGAGAVTALQGIPFTIVDGGPTGSGFTTTGGLYSFLQLDPITISSTQYEFAQLNPAGSGVLKLSDIASQSIGLQGAFTIQFT